MPLGTPAPDFKLPDVISGNDLSLSDFSGDKALLVMFICRHCPYVVHVREMLVELANTYGPQGVAFAAISSNDAENYPDDAPEKLREMAIESAFPFPMLYDQSQEVAHAYTAACTPDFFLFDAERKLAYRGRLDASTPGNSVPVTGEDMCAALDAVVEGKAVPQPHQPSLGCSIKWK